MRLGRWSSAALCLCKPGGRPPCQSQRSLGKITTTMHGSQLLPWLSSLSSILLPVLMAVLIATWCYTGCKSCRDLKSNYGRWSSIRCVQVMEKFCGRSKSGEVAAERKCQLLMSKGESASKQDFTYEAAKKISISWYYDHDQILAQSARPLEGDPIH
jgi:hypothetical protein